MSYDGAVVWRRAGRLSLYGSFDTTFFPRDSSYLSFRIMFWEVPTSIMSLKFESNSSHPPVYFKNQDS